MNDIDGLENFDGRIAYLNLAENDLGVDDAERIGRFVQSNPYLDTIIYSNTEIINTWHTSRR